ncbi:MAG: amidohydrolase [Nocardioides sp.]|uniref:amidohydrolase n=1 Tax=Nocardioides sp. TaxID=35761 RepID=UPI0039E4C19D
MLTSANLAAASRLIQGVVDRRLPGLIELRRDLHAHPELAFAELRTTDCVAAALADSAWQVTRHSATGLIADLGDVGPRVALRADLDALPVQDTTADPWRSTVVGVAHACGHDVHTACLVGAGLALAELHAEGGLPGRVRLLFQPAEEKMPGGALAMMTQGALEEVEHIFALHCDPSTDVGMVGLREGPITGASDLLDVRLSGKGGHTSRPHLTEDLTFALAKLVTELPAILSRRMDPRAGVSVSWGIVQAGGAPNVIPTAGRVAGTVRMLDAVAWADAEHLVRELVGQILAPYGVAADITYLRGVPPVVNERDATQLLGAAIDRVVGESRHVATSQSLGGEDFGWFLESVPGAMGRLGTRTPGGPTFDLHQGDLRIDEGAIGLGARILAEAAVGAVLSPA